METIRGVVSRKLWEDADTGRVILTVGYESGGGIEEGKVMVTAPGIEKGDPFLAQGEWAPNRFHGKTENVFRASRLRPDLPQTRAGAERFLRVAFSEGQHGIGREQVRRMLDAHGADIIRRATQDAGILVPFSARPDECRDAIISEWGRRTRGRQAMSLMEESGLGDSVIDRIIAAWRTQALENLRTNPWRAARIPKVQFSDADRVGKHLGFSPDDPKRLSESVVAVLRKQEDQGSTCADVAMLLDNMGHISGIDVPTLEGFLRRAIQCDDQEFFAFDTPRGTVAASRKLYAAEAAITQGLVRLLSRGRRNAPEQVRLAAEALFARPEFARFDEVQRTAVTMAATEPVSIVTGGPGTGKSTVMEAVAQLSELLDGGPLFLVAPVGKAAKRLAETTRRDACTVHRMLKAGVDAAGRTVFAFGRSRPLPPRSFVVIDESSMEDAELMAAVLDAMPPDGRLLLTGDDGQLPSVGAGAVLADMLAARWAGGGRPVIPSVKLEEVYRTDKDSGIARGAALVRAGEVPALGPEGNGGVSFNEIRPQDIVAAVERLVCETLPGQGFDPMRDVAVLCPQAPGPGGTWEINRRLSARLNPNGARIPGVEPGESDDPKMPIPRVGDRVMLTENDAGQHVMNGDIGTITGSGRGVRGRPTIQVKFDCGTEVEYPASRWRSLILAYAGTVHKSQGSQYRAVVMPMCMAHERMLDRSIVYTGWTRAQERLFLLGEHAAFEHGVRTSRTGGRMTLLRGFLDNLNTALVHLPDMPDWGEAARRARRALLARRGTGKATPGRPRRLFTHDGRAAAADGPAPSRHQPVARLFGGRKGGPERPSAASPQPSAKPAAPPPKGRLFGLAGPGRPAHPGAQPPAARDGGAQRPQALRRPFGAHASAATPTAPPAPASQAPPAAREAGTQGPQALRRPFGAHASSTPAGAPAPAPQAAKGAAQRPQALRRPFGAHAPAATPAGAPAPAPQAPPATHAPGKAGRLFRPAPLGKASATRQRGAEGTQDDSVPPRQRQR